MGEIVSSIISSIGNWIFGNQQQNKEFAQQEKMMNMQNAEQEKLFGMQSEFNKSEREAQNAWNLEQWNRENEYNSPQAQLQRAMAAGINPNSVFGNGQYGAIQSSHIEAGSAQAGLPSAAGPGSIPSIAPQMAQLGSNLFKDALTFAQMTGQKIENQFKPMLSQAEYDKMQKDIDYIAKQSDWTEAKTKEVKEMLPLTKECTSKQIAKFAEEVQNLIEERENIKAMRNQISATTQNIEADTRVKDAQEKGLKLDNDYKIFKKLIRDKLGIDPDQSLGQALAVAFMQNPDKFLENVKSVIQAATDWIGDEFGDEEVPPATPETRKSFYDSVLGASRSAWNPIANPLTSGDIIKAVAANNRKKLAARRKHNQEHHSHVR